MVVEFQLLDTTYITTNCLKALKEDASGEKAAKCSVLIWLNIIAIRWELCIVIRCDLETIIQDGSKAIFKVLRTMI